MMLRRVFSLPTIAFLLCLICLSGFASAQTEEDEGTPEWPDAVTLTGEIADPQFIAANLITVSAVLSDDLFAAGETITVDQTTAEDIFAAGRLVSLSGIAAESAVLAGQRVSFGGRLLDDLIAAGETVTVRGDSRMDGNAILAGRTIRLEGVVGGVVRAGGEHVDLAASITGDASVYARSVVLESNARIGGRLRLIEGTDLTIASDAVVTGGVEWMDAPRAGGPPMPQIMSFIGGWFAVAVTTIALAVIAAFAIPGLFAAAAAQMRNRPGRSVLIGLGLLIGMPIAAVLLFATLAGIPVALALMALWLTLSIAAVVTASLWLGQTLMALLKRPAVATGRAGRVGRAALGALALSILGAVPFLGGVVWLAAILVGLGAVGVSAWTRLSSPATV